MAILTVEDGSVILSIPMYFKRQSGRKLLVVADDIRRGAQGLVLSNNIILQRIARAKAWMNMLNEQTTPTVKDLAKQCGLDRSNVSRQLRLATISPRIVEAVIAGRAPDGLSVDKLIAVKSDDWDEQEREIGLE